jgi:hypothetical protein
VLTGQRIVDRVQAWLGTRNRGNDLLQAVLLLLLTVHERLLESLLLLLLLLLIAHLTV